MVYAWDVRLQPKPKELGRWQVLERSEWEVLISRSMVRVLLPHRTPTPTMIPDVVADEEMVMETITLVPFDNYTQPGDRNKARFSSKDDQDRFFVWLYDIDVDAVYRKRHPRRRKPK